MPFRCRLITVPLSIVAFGHGLGQPPPQPRGAESRFRAETDMVLIPASVTDRDNKFVAGLDPADFRVFDETVRIRQFSVEDAPISTLSLLDTSKSMQNKIDGIRIGLRRYLDAAMPEDDFCLVTFNDAIRGPCNFTRDARPIVDEALLAVPNGGTRLIDAIIFSLSEIKKGRNARKVLLILSDGVNTASRFNWRDAERYARETTACVYAVVAQPWQDEEIYSVRRLEEVAELTGGRTFEVNRRRNYPDFFEALDIRRQYIIGFKPAGLVHDGRYRRVKVQLQGSDTRNLRICWKHGYYEPLAMN